MKKKLVSLALALSLLATLLCAVSVNLSAASLPAPVELTGLTDWSGNANASTSDPHWDRKYDDAMTVIQDEAFSFEATVENYECYSNGRLDINFGCSYGETVEPRAFLRYGLMIVNSAADNKDGVTLRLYSQTSGRGVSLQYVGGTYSFPQDADISSFTVKIEMNSEHLVTVSIDGKKLFEESIATDDAERQFKGGGFFFALFTGYLNDTMTATATVKNAKVAAASLKPADDSTGEDNTEDNTTPNPGTGSVFAVVVLTAAVSGAALVGVSRRKSK